MRTLKKLAPCFLFILFLFLPFYVMGQQEDNSEAISVNLVDARTFRFFQEKLSELWQKFFALENMMATINISASKEYYYLWFSKNPEGTGKGRVISTPRGIDCKVDCSMQYAKFGKGKRVRLRAIQSQDSVFKGWSGSCSGTYPTCYVVMDSSKMVSARFDSKTKKILEVYKEGQGFGIVKSVSPSGIINCGSLCSASLVEGTKVKLEAKPLTGYKFSMWSGCDTSSGSSCTINMSSDKPSRVSVTAFFEPKSYETHRINVLRSGGSRIQRVYSVPQDRPRGLNCSPDILECSGDFYKGIDVELSASVPPQVAVTWYGCDRITNYGFTCVIGKINRDRDIYVEFR